MRAVALTSAPLEPELDRRNFLPLTNLLIREAMFRPALIAIVIAALPAPLAAKDSLGVFEQWGAFRDPSVPRCYAIAAAEAGSRPSAATFSIGTWPRRGVRGQVHVRLSRAAAKDGSVTLTLGGRQFALTGAGADAWAQDARMDAAIVAALRAAGSMSVSARDGAGRRFTDRYRIEGAATAMDAATVGCARLR